MNIDRNRAVEPSSSSWSAAEGSSTRTGPCRLTAFAAALAATVLMLSTTPAPAETEYNLIQSINAPMDTLTRVVPASIYTDRNDALNPRFTSVTFSTMDYYDDTSTGLFGSLVTVKPKTAAELNAMDNPPSNPFTVTADATWTDDTGTTKEVKITFKTTWSKESPPPTPPTPTPTPTPPAETEYDLIKSVNAPMGTLTRVVPDSIYDSRNDALNARFTSVTFSTMDYYDDSSTGLFGSLVTVKPKTAAELNAMDIPPPNPFTVTAGATWTDDTGTTKDVKITFKTTWPKELPPTPTGVTLSVTTQEAPPGSAASGYADYFFSNAGQGARLTDVSFSTMEYYNADRTGLYGGFLDVTAKTSEELNAMDPPPPNPFTVQVTVTMRNNAGEEATGTIDYVTRY